MNYFFSPSVPKKYELSKFEKFKQHITVHIILFATYTINSNNLYHYNNVDPISTNIIDILVGHGCPC